MSFIEYLAPSPRWWPSYARKSRVSSDCLRRAKAHLEDTPAKFVGDLTGAAVRFAADCYDGRGILEMLEMVHNPAWRQNDEKKFRLDGEEWEEGLMLALSWEVQKIERGKVRR